MNMKSEKGFVEEKCYNLLSLLIYKWKLHTNYPKLRHKQHIWEYSQVHQTSIRLELTLLGLWLGI